MVVNKELLKKKYIMLVPFYNSNWKIGTYKRAKSACNYFLHSARIMIVEGNKLQSYFRLKKSNKFNPDSTKL